jgi:hypothetical protein
MATRVAPATIIAGFLLAVPVVIWGQGTVIQIDVERDITINGHNVFDWSGTQDARPPDAALRGRFPHA